MLSRCNTKDESKLPWIKTKRKHQLMQGTDIPIQKDRPFIHAHAHSRWVRLRPACVTLHRMH